MQQKINGRQSLNRTNQGRAIGEGSHVVGPQLELRRQARSHVKQEKREIERINKGKGGSLFDSFPDLSNF